MRILILQPMPPKAVEDRPAYVDAVARLGARLRERGHEPSLMIVREYDEESLRLKIADVRPELLVVYLESYYTTLVRRLTEHVAGRHYLPIIVGGPHATVAPHETLSLIGVEGIVLCEWDRAVPDYLEARRVGPDYINTPGFWFRSEAGIVRNPIAEPEKPEEMVVVPDRSLYSADQILDGHGRIDILATRGCSFYCAHCQQDLAAGLYEEGNMASLRRRPVQALATEVEHLRTTYPAMRGLRFVGCTFPLDVEYLNRYTEIFCGPMRVPFTARVKTSELTAETAELLRKCGCYELELEVLSGSDFIRNEIFNLDLSERQILEAFAACRTAELKTRALVQVGLPYDTVVTIEQTGKLVRRAGADAVDVSIYYPLPGTKAHHVCQENGWLSGRGADAFLAGQSALDMPGLDAATIKRYATLLPHLVHNPKAWPALMKLERLHLGKRSLADLVAPLLGQRWGRNRGGHG
ncbi:MAG: radical SAM protein [Planctomycetes bacterium]|nr:radical SAM protein [Planctomycetota bacterium]